MTSLIPATAQLPGARDGRDPARAIKRGPSRVPRELVAAAQRDRLYDGLVRTVAEHGYANATVSDICRAAGVTRPAFYEHFTGKEAAFLAAYQHGTGVVYRMMEEARALESGWRDATCASLRVLLDVLAGVPAFAVMAVVEIEAVGPHARAARAQLLKRFATFFDDAPGLPPALDRTELVDTVVGGVYAAVFQHIATGHPRDLPELLPTLAYFVVAPFLGPQEAMHAQRLAHAPAPRAVAPCVPQFLAPRRANPHLGTPHHKDSDTTDRELLDRVPTWE